MKTYMLLLGHRPDDMHDAIHIEHVCPFHSDPQELNMTYGTEIEHGECSLHVHVLCLVIFSSCEVYLVCGLGKYDIDVENKSQFHSPLSV